MTNSDSLLTEKRFLEMAAVLARDTGTDVEISRQQLRRLYRDYRGRPLYEGEHRSVFGDLLEYSFECSRVKPSKSAALTVIDHYDLSWIANALKACNWISTWPAIAYTLDELAMWIDEFLRLAESNQANMIEHGHPVFVFSMHPYIDRLARNYYTRLPAVITVSDTSGGKKRVLNRIEFNEIDPFQDTRIEIGCTQDARYSYRWFHRMHGLSPYLKEWSLPKRDLVDLERLREPVFRAKVDVLRHLTKTLRSRTPDGLFDDCVDIISARLTDNDWSFLADVEVWCDKGGFGISYLDPDDEYEIISGGLFDLLDLVGFCECELQVGLWCKTREALGDIVRESGSRTGRMPFDSYFDVMDLPFRAVVDKALRVFCELAPETERAWAAHYGRVQRQLPQPEFPWRSAGAGTHKLQVFENGFYVMHGGQKYRFRRKTKKFDALMYMLIEAKNGNRFPDKYDVATMCNIPLNVYTPEKRSLRSWFVSGGGDPERFAKRFMKSDRKGGCEILIDPELIEIYQYKDYSDDDEE